MIFAIHAYEGTYGGLHGIESFRVIQCDSRENAEQLAQEDSVEVMYSYGDIVDSFRQEAEDEGLEEGTEDFEAYIGECIDGNVAYEVYEVVNPVGSLEEMETEFYNDPDEFIKEHCRED